MTRRLSIAAALFALLAVSPGSAGARGLSPAGLTKAGWTCFNGPAFNPNVHCAPPGWEDVVAGEAKHALLFAFATLDLEATDAEFLGTERMIHEDLYNGQPCRTDPGSGPDEGKYSDLGPLLGLNYFICHTFDSPWGGFE